jgi:hypothetical protein
MAQQCNYEAYRWWLRTDYPVFGRHQWATNPFGVANILMNIANLQRPWNKIDTVWVEDLSERFPAEWEQVITQVRLQGGPSLDPAPMPWIERVLKLGLGNWTRIQWIARGWLLQKRVQHLCIQQGQIQHRLDEVLSFVWPRRTVFL